MPHQNENRQTKFRFPFHTKYCFGSGAGMEANDSTGLPFLLPHAEIILGNIFKFLIFCPLDK